MFQSIKKMFASSDNSALQQALKNGAFLIDVRTPSEFALGSVPGAVNIPLDKLTGHIPKLAGKKNIVVFCRSGGRSSQAKLILERNGCHNVVNGGSREDVIRMIHQSKQSI